MNSTSKKTTKRNSSQSSSILGRIDDIMQEYLDKGIELLGAEIGIVSRIKDEKYYIMQVSTNKLGIKKGDQFSLADTYCKEVCKENKLVAIPEVGKHSTLKNHPIYLNMKLESYLACPLIISGKIYGTINFTSTQVKDGGFSPWQISLIEFMGKTLSGFIESNSLLKWQLQQREQQHVSSRILATGEMAKNIAFEVNNPMAVVVGNVLILEDLLNHGKLSKRMAQNCIDTIKKSVGKVTELTQRLTKQSADNLKDGSKQYSLIETIRLVETELAQRLGKKHVKLEVSVPREISIYMNQSHMAEVLKRMINNSIDAIESLADKWISIKAKTEDSKVLLTIKDSGPGLDPVVAEHLMEPFFTTKKERGGKGLGLSICKGILELYGGGIAHKDGAFNTEFTLSLPMAS